MTGNLLFDDGNNIVMATWDVIRNYEIYKPIQLTTQWLIDLGFRKHKDSLNFEIDSGKYYNAQQQVKISKLKLKLTKAGNWRVINYANGSIYLEFIHELQNLYFSITKKQLLYNKNHEPEINT
ncbi:hypothetical protein HZP15_06895 [Elizabethkingia anophelis]|nr:hypothetical protein [Elizabethkingia anophelis]